MYIKVEAPHLCLVYVSFPKPELLRKSPESGPSASSTHPKTYPEPSTLSICACIIRICVTDVFEGLDQELKLVDENEHRTVDLTSMCPNPGSSSILLLWY